MKIQFSQLFNEKLLVRKILLQNSVLAGHDIYKFLVLDPLNHFQKEVHIEQEKWKSPLVIRILNFWSEKFVFFRLAEPFKVDISENLILLK